MENASAPSGVVCIRWNHHVASLVAGMSAMQREGCMQDVTIWCEGRKVRAHKIVLAAFSPYFKWLFQPDLDSHPTIVLPQVSYSDLLAIIEFIYNGEVTLPGRQLSSMLRTADKLLMRGLTERADQPLESLVPPDRSEPQPGPSGLGMPRKPPAEPDVDLLGRMMRGTTITQVDWAAKEPDQEHTETWSLSDQSDVPLQIDIPDFSSDEELSETFQDADDGDCEMEQLDLLDDASSF